jgi:hypothetical protein
MAINTISNAARTAMCDAFVDLLDVGATDAGGDCKIWTTAFGTLLAEPEFGATAFGAATNGVATVNTVTADPSAVAGGTAAVCRFHDRANLAIAEGTVTAGGAGDLDLNTLTITALDVVDITGGTITMPAA